MNQDGNKTANAHYDAKLLSRRRRLVQWVLAPITIIVIALGWRYPLLGFAVPIVMLTGIAGAFINGRYVCGHLCPRGAFFDRIIAPLSPGRPIPAFLRTKPLRWTLVVLLMGFMTYQIAQNPGDVYHWGRVFWLMCVITTGAGVLLAVINQRTWCALCPIGTIQAAIGGSKGELLIDPETCRECGACEKVCPINIPIVKHKAEGVVREPDCLRCPECIRVCPVGALRWPDSDKQFAAQEKNK
ncbi:MAG: 4Fe-4S binding protein [Armatimonadota bacterium]|nr:4Fe-4S binding protein [Armatimonadota bacterium]